MVDQINVHPNVKVDYRPVNTNKQVRITANTLLAGTVLPVYNSEENTVLTSSSNPNFKNFSGRAGGVGFGAFLLLEFDRTSGYCTVGPNASFDDSEPSNAAAYLSITFADSIPAGATAPGNINNGIEFWTQQLPSTHYLDLKSFANGKRYCQVKVNLMANQTTALLEGQVYIHLIQNAASTSPCVIYAIEDGPSSENGEPIGSVQNANVYFDLTAGSYLYLVAMIGKKGNNPWTFEVGDPKTDAGVGASEV